jgi:hypothetical protein
MSAGASTGSSVAGVSDAGVVIGATIGSSAAGFFGMGFFRADTGFGRIFGPAFFGFTVLAATFFGFTVLVAAFVGLADFAAVFFGFTVFIAAFFGFSVFVAAFFGFAFFFAIVLFSGKKNWRLPRPFAQNGKRSSPACTTLSERRHCDKEIFDEARLWPSEEQHVRSFPDDIRDSKAEIGSFRAARADSVSGQRTPGILNARLVPVE